MQVGQSYAKIIIVASWKMGSTLLADLLGSHPSSLVLYEPLWHYGVERLTTQKAPFITYVNGPYTNYLDRILAIFYPLHPPCRHLAKPPSASPVYLDSYQKRICFIPIKCTNLINELQENLNI